MGGDPQAGPLLEKLSESTCSSSEEHPVKRTGTVWTASAHIITAVIGSGVLSLAWSVAQLGWVGGPAAMVFFAGVTVVQSSLLAECYVFRGDPERGGAVVRNRSYMDAVRLHLGKKRQMLSGFFLSFSLFGSSVVYTLTAATSMRAIHGANCYRREGYGATCSAAATGGSDAYYMLLFGLAQVVLSQIPDVHDMAWLSVFAAVMSFFYSFVGFGLGAAKVIENGVIKGRIGGIPLASPVQKVWRVAQSLGDIAFAYPYTLVLLEIEDTLRSPPAESQTMKRASRASVAITTFFYLGCGCFGYAAFGDATPGNLLTGFGEPYWLIDLANLCVVLHLLGGYQLYSHPAFTVVERRFGAEAWVVEVELPLIGRRRRVNVFRLCFRTAYVAAVTAVAVWYPYFNQVVGLIGAFTFWPLDIHFPVEMYLAQAKVAPWTRRWLAIQAFSATCLLVAAFACVGSAVGVFGPDKS